MDADDLLARQVPAEKIAILGFSQGACLTSEFAARNPRRYGAVIAFTGGLIGPPGTPRNYAGSLVGTSMFLGTSDPDPHVPFARVQETADVLVPIAPGRSGVDWMRQRVPLHISANASTDGRAVTSEPTALQEDAEPQDTAANPLLVGLPDPPLGAVLGAVPGAALASLPSAGTLVT